MSDLKRGGSYLGKKNTETSFEASRVVMFGHKSSKMDIKAEKGPSMRKLSTICMDFSFFSHLRVC